MQLDRGARLFVNQQRNVQVDSARGEVRLSPLFDWYKEDFGGSAEALVGFIARYRPDGALLRQGKWNA